MRHCPQARGNDQRIDSLFLPPGALVAPPVKFAMVQPADRNGEAVADLPPHRALLGKLDVVGIRRGAAADEARLSGYEPQMLAIAFAHGLADDRDRLLGRIDLLWLVALPIGILMFGCGQPKFLELVQPGGEGILDRLGVRL